MLFVGRLSRGKGSRGAPRGDGGDPAGDRRRRAAPRTGSRRGRVRRASTSSAPTTSALRSSSVRRSARATASSRARRWHTVARWSRPPSAACRRGRGRRHRPRRPAAGSAGSPRRDREAARRRRSSTTARECRARYRERAVHLGGGDGRDIARLPCGDRGDVGRNLRVAHRVLALDPEADAFGLTREVGPSGVGRPNAGLASPPRSGSDARRASTHAAAARPTSAIRPDGFARIVAQASTASSGMPSRAGSRDQSTSAVAAAAAATGRSSSRLQRTSRRRSTKAPRARRAERRGHATRDPVSVVAPGTRRRRRALHRTQQRTCGLAATASRGRGGSHDPAGERHGGGRQLRRPSVTLVPSPRARARRRRQGSRGTAPRTSSRRSATTIRATSRRRRR